MKKLTIKTLGCKVNQCESEAIQQVLLESHQEYTAAGAGRADVVIVNTCSVTQKAAMQSRQAVRKAIRANPGAHIVVTGCHAQTAPAELAAIDGVDMIVGNRDKHRIADRLLNQDPDGFQADLHDDHADIDAVDRFAVLPGVAYGNRTRPFVKIQDGCNAFCTYCIVPHARGRSRSLPVQQVLSQIKQLGRLGYREVVLTGIHIGCYGQDLTPATGLYDLLCRIQDSRAIDRIRISSIEPAELSDAIIGLAASDDDQPCRLCPHFHIPLQSGDDGILKRMKRPYTRDFFEERVATIIDRLPDAAIGVDALVGFPGETDQAFENTYGLIRSLPVAYLHVFPFSARQGTPAFTYKDQVPEALKKQNCRRLRNLGEQKRRAFYGRRVGEILRVLVEESRDRPDGRLKGVTDNYISVRFDGPSDFFNTFQWVKIEGISSDGQLEGVPIGPGDEGLRP